MTTINLTDYVDPYIESCEENYAHKTALAKRYVVQQLTKQVKTLDLSQEYAATDQIKEYYRSTNMYKAKAVHVCDFLKFIGQRVGTREQHQLESLADRVKYTRVTDHHKEKGGGTINEKQDKLIAPHEFKAAFEEMRVLEDTVIEAAVKLMFDTGMRPGEAAALYPEDIVEGTDRDGYAADVKVTKKYADAKGKIVPVPKRASDRRVSLKHPTLTLVETVMEEGEPLFPSYQMIKYYFKKYFTEAGVRLDSDGKTELTPHCIRHTTLTYLLNIENWSKEDLQEYAGHSSITITEGYAKFVDLEFFDGIQQVMWK